MPLTRNLSILEPLIVPIQKMKQSIFGTEERPTAFRQFPGELQKTIETGSWMPQPIRGAVQTAQRFITPETPEEAGKYGMINIGTQEQPRYFDITGGGAMKVVGGKVAQQVPKVAPKVFKGFKDLTTKFLEYARGKTALSKQEIMDFARRPELKKGEADLLLKKLEEFDTKVITAQKGIIPQVEKGEMSRKTIDYFKSQIQQGKEILPVIVDKNNPTRIVDGNHRYVAYQELGIEPPIVSVDRKQFLTDAVKISEREALIKQGIAVKGVKEAKIPAQEFADSLRRDLLELKPVKVKEPQYRATTIQSNEDWFMNKNKNYEEVVFESPITTNGSSHYPNSKNYFAHARGDEVVEGGKKIWREQEIQSDVLQKEGLENFFGTEIYKMINEGKSATEIRKAMGNWNPNTTVQDIQGEIDKLKALNPFTNERFGERIMRERIKEKASKGYAKYRLPTGETIGKIEGFEGAMPWKDITNEADVAFGDLPDLTPETLKVGKPVEMMNQPGKWIITDILGDGRFKAVPKESVFPLKGESLQVKYAQRIKGTNLGYEETATETFDLTGKSNPQYRRYEDWGKFLKNKYGGKQITDPQGNTWWEIDLRRELGKLPVEAFGLAPLLELQQDEDNRRRIFQSTPAIAQ